MARGIDISGVKFGRLTARHPVGSRKNIGVIWECDCDCGGKIHVPGTYLRSNTTKSCGCIKKDLITERNSKSKVDGVIRSEHPLYETWCSMKKRCSNKNSKSYINYGARGIRVCKRWEESFESFVIDMGPRPKDKSLERIDNDEGYYPGNCRWATRSDQSSNRRHTWGNITGERNIHYDSRCRKNPWLFRVSLNKSTKRARFPSLQEAIEFRDLVLSEVMLCVNRHEHTEKKNIQF